MIFIALLLDYNSLINTAARILQVASQLYLWLEDQDRRDEAAAESAASKLRDIYRREVDCDIAGIVLRRDTQQRNNMENSGGFQGNDGNWNGEYEYEEEAVQEDEGDSDGWGTGGVHYSEYLAAAAAATKAAARTSNAPSDAMSPRTEAVELEAKESKGIQMAPRVPSEEASAPFSPPATPAAAPPATPVNDNAGHHAETSDVTSPSVRFELGNYWYLCAFAPSLDLVHFLLVLGTAFVTPLRSIPSHSLSKIISFGNL